MNIAEENLVKPSPPNPPPVLLLHLIPDIVDKIASPTKIIDSAPIIIVTTVPPPPPTTTTFNEPVHDDNITPTSTPVSPSLPTLIPNDTAMVSTTCTPPISEGTGDFELSSKLFGNSVDVSIVVKGDRLTPGLVLLHDPDTLRITLHLCAPSTPAARIHLWHSTLRGGHIVAINDNPVETITDISKLVASSSVASTQLLRFTFVPMEHVNIQPDTNVTQIISIR